MVTAKARYEKDLKAVGGDVQFAALSASVQALALTQLAKHKADSTARKTIMELSTSQGFSKLSPADQAKTLRFIGGSNVEISKPARGELQTLLSSPEFKAAKSADQAKRLQEFIINQQSAPAVVSSRPGAFDASRLPYAISKPTEVKAHKFRTGTADALMYQVKVGGNKITVYMPKNFKPANGKQHSIEEIAKSIAALPEASRKEIRRVVVQPAQNPDDAYWAEKYGFSDFSSYMTAGNGEIHVYPTPTKTSQDYLDGSMIHETGHLLSRREFGQDGSKAWNAWKGTIAGDGIVASAYAKNSPAEDFSETFHLFIQVRGTAQEAEIRALMPNRMKIIDKLLADKK